MSINVGPANNQGQRTCELNDFTDESPSHTGLQEVTGHIHYSAEVSDIIADYHHRRPKLTLREKVVM